MKQVSFIHIADLHLDTPFSSLGDEDKARIRRNEVEGVLTEVIDKILEDNIDLLFISGDLFEDKYVKGTTILKLKNMFSEIYNTEIVIIPGNHDPISDTSYYKTTVWGSNVHILEGTEQALYLDKLNTCIHSIGVTNNIKSDYLRISTTQKFENIFNVLLLHGTVDMPFEEENYNSITSKELFNLNMDYIALGHMHNFSQIKNGSTVMVNPGSPEPLGFDEEGMHGYIIGSININDDGKKYTQASFFTRVHRQYHCFDEDISGCSSDAEVVEKLRPILAENDLYKLNLTGFISRDFVPDLGAIHAALKDKCFFVKIKNESSIRFEYESYLEDPGIKGEFVRRLIDRLETEETKEVRDTLFQALQYGLQALENERVD